MKTNNNRILDLRPWFTAALLIGAAMLGGCSGAPSTEKTAQTFAFWPPYPDEPRIQFLTSYQFSKDIEEPGTKLEELIYGEAGQQVLPINKPYGVAMNQGRIYVCDIRSPSVVVLDLRKRQTRVIGTTGVARLERPTDVAIAPDGLIYIADIGGNRIVVFDQNERYVTRFQPPQFKPGALAVTQEHIYVSDYVSKQILVLDRLTGQELRRIGTPDGGGNDGQFIRPLGVTVDKQGRLIVSDVLKARIQIFSPEGKFLSGFGEISTGIGGFVRPKHLVTDSDDRIYVVDAAFQNVQIFTYEGKLLTWFGNAGEHPGAMFLPVGIAEHEGDLDLFQNYLHPSFQAERLLIVTNQFGPAKVAVYALGRLKPGATVEDIRVDLAEVNLGLDDSKPDPTPSPPRKPGDEPGAEPKAEPVAEPKAEPEAEPKAEPKAEPEAEPAVEPTDEPVAEPTAEPEAEPEAEPVASPKMNPSPQAADIPAGNRAVGSEK